MLLSLNQKQREEEMKRVVAENKVRNENSYRYICTPEGEEGGGEGRGQTVWTLKGKGGNTFLA